MLKRYKSTKGITLIALENIASHCDTNVQKSDTEIELEKDIEIEKRVRKVWRYR